MTSQTPNPTWYELIIEGLSSDEVEASLHARGPLVVLFALALTGCGREPGPPVRAPTLLEARPPPSGRQLADAKKLAAELRGDAP